MKKGHIFVGAIAIDVTIADQVTKWLATEHLQAPWNFTSWFSLAYAENTGVAFSFPVPYQLLIPLSLIMVVVIVAYGFRALNMDSPLSMIVLGFITGGAAGNMIDRVVRGFVIDFIQVGWWPTFNLADAFLTVGIFLLLAFYGKIKRV